jgi:hypothetical protein
MKVYELIEKLQAVDPELAVLSPVLNGDFSDEINVDVDVTDGERTLIIEGQL